MIIIIIVIIIKALVQHMSVKNKLTSRSCGLATAVSDGKICLRDVFLSCDKNWHDTSGSSFNWGGRLFQTTGAALRNGEHCAMANEVETYYFTHTTYNYLDHIELKNWVKIPNIKKSYSNYGPNLYPNWTDSFNLLSVVGRFEQ